MSIDTIASMIEGINSKRAMLLKEAAKLFQLSDSSALRYTETKELQNLLPDSSSLRHIQLGQLKRLLGFLSVLKKLEEDLKKRPKIIDLGKVQNYLQSIPGTLRAPFQHKKDNGKPNYPYKTFAPLYTTPIRLILLGTVLGAALMLLSLFVLSGEFKLFLAIPGAMMIVGAMLYLNHEMDQSSKASKALSAILSMTSHDSPYISEAELLALLKKFTSSLPLLKGKQLDVAEQEEDELDSSASVGTEDSMTSEDDDITEDEEDNEYDDSSNEDDDGFPMERVKEDNDNSEPTVGKGPIKLYVRVENSSKKSSLFHFYARVTEKEAQGEELEKILFTHLKHLKLAAENSTISLAYLAGTYAAGAKITPQNQKEAIDFIRNSKGTVPLLVRIETPEARKEQVVAPVADVAVAAEPVVPVVNSQPQPEPVKKVSQDDQSNDASVASVHDAVFAVEAQDGSQANNAASKQPEAPVQKEESKEKPKAVAEVHEDPQPAQQQESEQHKDNSVAALVVDVPAAVAAPAPQVQAKSEAFLFGDKGEKISLNRKSFSEVFGEKEEEDNWFVKPTAPVVAASSAAKPAAVEKPAVAQIPVVRPQPSKDHATFFAASAVVGPLKAEKQYPAGSKGRKIQHENDFAKGPSSPKEEPKKQPLAPIELKSIRKP